ncbi:alpha/beta hydrolase [Williamsia sp. 1135]|uniref:alpha/beta hydrolase n=1 Tax=Williamsia sp. 1135 TaxID=1889262 RepID=UPI000A0FC325|nr:alpha/beta hydrolase [Williamsia sp. 1135]ORM26872.1 alpha/beta hydrolase [Williamsia sp. 1135]
MVVTRHRHPSLRSYPVWLASRLLIKPALTLWPIGALGLRPLFLIDEIFALGPKAKGIVREQMELAGRPVELSLPAGPSNRDEATAILYLHGGAMVVCGLATHRAVASRLCRDTGLPVYSVAYRQLPEAGVGTSATDAYQAYRELITERGFSHVVVAGDSAGGFLSGKVIEFAHRDGMPAPAAFIGYSPLLDLDLAANPDRTSRSDAYLPIAKLGKLRPRFDQGPIALRGARRIADVPSEAFPPTILVTAEDEMLEPDALELIEKLAADGVQAELHSYSWQVHAFPVLAGRLPDALRAIARTAAFAKEAAAAARARRGNSELEGVG